MKKGLKPSLRQTFSSRLRLSNMKKWLTQPQSEHPKPSTGKPDLANFCAVKHSSGLAASLK